MFIILFVLANSVVISVSKVPFFLPKFQNNERHEQLGFTAFLNKSANPCDNFYEYTCGGWIENTVPPKFQPFWNQWQFVTQKIFKRLEVILKSKKNASKYLLKAQNVYNACIFKKNSDTRYLNKLKTLINDLNGWPILTPAWNASDYDWAVSIAKVTRMLGIHPLLNMHVFIDLKNTSQHILYIEHGELNMPQAILTFPLKYKHYIKAYLVWIIQTIQYLYPNKTHVDLQAEVTEMINFEIELAQLNLYKDKSEKISVKKFSKEFPLKWTEVFEKLFYSTTITMSSNDMVILRSSKYLTKLLLLLSNIKTRTVGRVVSIFIFK